MELFWGELIFSVDGEAASPQASMRCSKGLPKTAHRGLQLGLVPSHLLQVGFAQDTPPWMRASPSQGAAVGNWMGINEAKLGRGRVKNST